MRGFRCYTFPITHRISPVEAKTRRGNLRYIETVKWVARINRKKPTPTESLLWQSVLRRRQTGYKFERQKPISRFIPDFYCSKLLLAIEVDGKYHLKRSDYDIARDKYFKAIGIKTIRISAGFVSKNIDSVKKFITNIIFIREKEIFNPPSLSQGKGAGGRV